MNFEVRKYHDSDLRDLVDLMAQLGYQHTEQSLRENIGAVRESGGEIFVADSRGKVYGCICAIFDIRLAAGTNGEIVSLVVDRSARGMGVGKGLVAKAESWLKQKTNRLRVRANSVRTEAHDFYKSLGYSFSKTQSVFTKNVYSVSHSSEVQ